MRRRSTICPTMTVGDPGKDLFAYLFILIMVFSFMLLMSMEQAKDIQKAPEQKTGHSSDYSILTKENIAQLVVVNSKLYLKFDKTLYDPISQLEKLKNDGRVQVKQNGNIKKNIIYVLREGNENVSLLEYLDTFKILSRNNIHIAFAKEIK